MDETAAPAGPEAVRIALRVVVREHSEVLRFLDCKLYNVKSRKPEHLTVIVTGLPADLSEAGLLELFSRFGDVDRIAVHASRLSAAVLYTDSQGPRSIWKLRGNEEPIRLGLALPETPFGLKGWVEEVKASRPGNAALQKQLDAWVEAYEVEERAREEAIKKAAAAAAEDGWTLVRARGKKRGPSEGMRRDGVSAGAAAQAARRKLDTGREDFYRFQKKEAQLLALRTKFEEDKKRIAAIRASRKFRPE